MAENIVYCDTSDLDKMIEEFRKTMTEDECRAALSKALNKTLDFVGAETKRQVQGEYYVTKSLQKSVQKKKATRADLSAEAIYTGKPIPLFVFKHTAPQNAFRSPVTVTVKRSNGPQTHTGSNPAMFRAYGRKIKLRQPGERNIHGAYTLSIPQMVSSDAVYEEIAKKAGVQLYKNAEYFLKERLWDKWL